ncbi:unnamed protein product [Prorocentrum cordatum]|uniref:Mannosyltransferase n=1 Tax=Prorocentrum cordatum TaxID=2364126 RepID=A0ABN9UZE8_9DINO|nr:unnamed protein product [Polarella glacialis]
MISDEEEVRTLMTDAHEHRHTCATLYQYHKLLHSHGAARPWYYSPHPNNCIFIWYPYIANFVGVALELSAYFSFFQDPVHICASSHLGVPSSTLSEVLALHRDKSDPFHRSVWVACVIGLSSFLCFVFGPLKDIANISDRYFRWLVEDAWNHGVNLYDVTFDNFLIMSGVRT